MSNDYSLVYTPPEQGTPNDQVLVPGSPLYTHDRWVDGRKIYLLYFKVPSVKQLDMFTKIVPASDLPANITPIDLGGSIVQGEQSTTLNASMSLPRTITPIDNERGTFTPGFITTEFVRDGGIEQIVSGWSEYVNAVCHIFLLFVYNR